MSVFDTSVIEYAVETPGYRQVLYTAPDGPERVRLVLQVRGSSVYIGGADVDNTNGIALSATPLVLDTLTAGDVLYGWINSENSASVIVMALAA